MRLPQSFTRFPGLPQWMPRSLGVSLLFYVLIGSFLGLGTALWLFFNLLEEHLAREIKGELGTQVNAFEADLAQARQSVYSLSAAVKTLHDQEIQNSETYKTLVFDAFQRRSPFVTGMGFGQAPYRILRDRAGFWPFFALDQSVTNQPGQRLLPPHQNIRYLDRVNDDYFQQSYYKGISAQRSYWLEPYRWHGRTLTTYTEPIRSRSNQIIGVAGLDVNVTAMSQRLKMPAIGGNGYFILLSAEGNLLVYPPDPSKAETLASYQDIAWLKPLWQQIQYRDRGILETEKEFIAFQRVDKTQWILLAVVPFEVLNPSFVITLTVTLLAGVLLTGIVVVFIKNLNRRLHPIVDRCQQLCKVQDSSIESPTFLTQKTDELGILEQTVEYMAAQLTDAFNLLETRVVERTTELSGTLQTLQEMQAQLIQSEKMSSLGQMVAGIAHEVNNPVSFIHGNLTHVTQYVEDLLCMIDLYQRHYPNPDSEIQRQQAELDLDFIVQDLPNLIQSMQMGTTRIQEIVRSLRNFSRLDEADCKAVDLHEGIENTLLILTHRLQATRTRGTIQVVKAYGNLPPVECYAGLLNQVFLNLLVNAVDALEEASRSAPDAFDGLNRADCAIERSANTIWIRTELTEENQIRITIADNGVGISEETKSRLFDPFFTTKPVGKGTGLGLSISYQIIEKHQGKLSCDSTLGEGTKFRIEIPVRQERG